MRGVHRAGRRADLPEALMRAQVLFFLGLLAVAYLALRVRNLAEDRRLLRHADDPSFQGDGWRWTLSLLLPNVLLPLRLVGRDGQTPMGTIARIMREEHGAPPPFTFDMLPLTSAQRIVCWAEWDATQRQYEAWEREQLP
jgi:hypothetical protein